MAVENGYKVNVVILDQHEPEGETATRLLEIAEDKGYSPRVVEAQRGEHDAGLSFRVPQDVAEAFDGERAELWPDDSAQRAERGQLRVDGSVSEDPKGKRSKIENVTEKDADQAADRTPAEPKARAKAPKE